MNDTSDSGIRENQKVELQPNALQKEASEELGSRYRIVGDRAEVLDSERKDTVGTRLGSTDKNEDMTATIMVKSKASDKEIDDTLAKLTAGQIKPLSTEEFNQQFGANPQSMEEVLNFAKQNNLTVEESELDSGKVLLKGKVGDFSNAFKVQFSDYKTDDGKIARERVGTFSLPTEIADDIQGVLGLDTRPDAKALFQKHPEQSVQFAPRISSGFMPNQVADAYQFPKESMGDGQSVAIIELGGGLDLADNAKYYADHGLKLPSIQLVGVDGASSQVGGDADGEVALDSQVIGAVAPDANQQLVFSTNTDQGFVDAVTRATFAEAGEKQNSAISISWGGRESSWDKQAMNTMDIAFKKAALKGISIFAASGDTGAGDLRPGQANDGKFVADYPASDPWLTATGGTRLTVDASGQPHEVAWNDGKNSSGGGGVSQIFSKPDYQNSVDVPVNTNPFDTGGAATGRGVPDVAGDASPATGYRVRFNGQEQVIGGTSAVAPLYAALTMRLNGALGQPVGFLNPFLYKHGNSGIFNDITVGNNNGFNTGAGWDAATGWGSIKGTEFLAQLRADQTANKTPSAFA